jgi:hypothetical protein
VLNLIQLGLGAAGASLCVINEYVDLSRLLNMPSFLFTPPFFLVTWFLIVFIFRFIRIFFWRDSGFTITKYGEWTEMCLAVGLALYAGLVVRRLVSMRAPASAPLVTPVHVIDENPQPDPS